MAQTYNYTQYRYNGTDWDTLYPATIAAQVIQSSTKVFLHPTTNTVNGKAFGSRDGDIWVPSAITLYGTDITVSSSDSTTLAAAVANVVKASSTFGTNNGIILADGTSRNVKGSSYHITSVSTSTNWSSVPAVSRDIAIPTMALIETYPGSTNITTVGTITSGTWNGTAIDIAHGGTGATTKENARTNLGLGSVATYDATNNASDIESAASDSNIVPTAYAVKQYASTIRITCDVVWSRQDYESTTAPSTSVLATIPQGVVVYYNNGDNSATGTLVAGSGQTNKILLVYSSNGTTDSFDEYLCVADDTSAIGYTWEKIGHTDVDLSGYVKKGTLSNGYIAIASSSDTINANTYAITSSGETVPAQNLDMAIPTEAKVRNTILAQFTGTSNITTLGTITTGTWHGTAIAASYIGNLASSKITTMTGYSIATSASAIATTDSLNTAIGKLEYKVDSSLSRAQIFWNTSTGNITGMSTGDFAFIHS